MTSIPLPPSLQGKFISIETLHDDHRKGLQKAANHEVIWTYMTYSAFGSHFDHWFKTISKNFKSGAEIPLVISTLSNHEIIGSTRFYNIVPKDRKLAIGYTWFTPKAESLNIMGETMFLLLSYIFGTLKYQRVELYTDVLNTPTQSLFSKLGATAEGVLKNHMIREDGTTRDSLLYSIIEPKWASIKQNLSEFLGVNVSVA